MTAEHDPEASAARLAHAAIGGGDPTGWFEPLYAAATAGTATVPWDRHAPSRYLVQWAAERSLRGTAATPALVVGCGLGDDAEFVAGLGFATTAFDIAPSAITAARRRFPDSAVHYRVADLMAPPSDWQLGFGLIVESMTLQALPEATRAVAGLCLAPLLAPGGTLIVLARGRPEDRIDEGPPFSLTRPEIEAIAHDGVQLAELLTIADDATGAAWRWRAEFRRS